MEALRGSSPSKNAAGGESPEQILDAFKAAALSVTKLYKTSAAAQAKARVDGYQDCLDDLLSFLDKNNIGLGDGEGWQIRKWATERLDGRDITQESDDEVDKAEPASSPEIHRSGSQAPLSTMRNDALMHQEPVQMSAHHVTATNSPTEEHPMITVPTQENFTFRSSHPYPSMPEAYPNLENLDLSDSTGTSDTAGQASSTVPITHAARSRNKQRGSRSKPSNHLGKGAGQKRSINLCEIFDVKGVTFGKDMFGREGKRSRHT
ncbi:hypothetical protein F5Y05DRAFT_371242 [Hypoxylon sp. FL0543]|nr:hypothetical protein F5Y05DRAFT_371242 [Hypoxylon sp. FL0543]